MKLCGHLFTLLSTVALALPARGGDPAPDPDLPQPLDAKAVASLLANPPFTRALNLSDSLTLTGIAYLEGKPVVTIFDKAAKESHVVSQEPNGQGWRLVQLSASVELRRTEARIMVGGETVTVRYSDEQLDPKASRPGGGSRSPGGPGGPVVGSDGQRIRTSSYLGEGGRERYYALSEGARDRFRELMRQRVEANPRASMEENSAYARREFERIEAEDRRGRERR